MRISYIHETSSFLQLLFNAQSVIFNLFFMKAPISSIPSAAGGDKRIASLEEENRQLKKGI